MDNTFGQKNVLFCPNVLSITAICSNFAWHNTYERAQKEHKTGNCPHAPSSQDDIKTS